VVLTDIRQGARQGFGLGMGAGGSHGVSVHQMRGLSPRRNVVSQHTPARVTDYPLP
jgi:hypothetical protein